MGPHKAAAATDRHPIFNYTEEGGQDLSTSAFPFSGGVFHLEAVEEIHSFFFIY